jgi:hypothetical protein
MGLLKQTAEPAKEVLGVETIDVVADKGYFKIEDIEACAIGRCDRSAWYVVRICYDDHRGHRRFAHRLDRCGFVRGGLDRLHRLRADDQRIVRLRPLSSKALWATQVIHDHFVALIHDQFVAPSHDHFVAQPYS